MSARTLIRSGLMIHWRLSRAITGGTLFDHPHVPMLLSSAELYTL